MKKACHSCIVKGMDPTSGFQRIWGAFLVAEYECNYCEKKLKSLCANHASEPGLVGKFLLNSKECFKCKEQK